VLVLIPGQAGKKKGINHMSDVSAIAASAVTMIQSNIQQQVSIIMLKNSVKADQKVASMIMENAKRIEELSEEASGHIDMYV
jgi:signal-transduction protein with cAMP-binding, CBS, and nucleotidyltransferase domain